MPSAGYSDHHFCGPTTLASRARAHLHADNADIREEDADETSRGSGGLRTISCAADRRMYPHWPLGGRAGSARGWRGTNAMRAGSAVATSRACRGRRAV